MIEGIAIFVLSIVLFVAILGVPFFLYKKITNIPKPKNKPYSEPCIYTNSFGHLVMISPDPIMQGTVEQYYTQNPEKAKQLLDGLHR